MNMTEAEYEAKLVAAGVLLEPPPIDYDYLNFTQSPDFEENVKLAKRQSDCWNTVLVTDKTETFTDWDVQMSPIVCAVGPMTISVTDGYMVSNSVTVSAGMDLKVIKDMLGTTFGINYGKTWTTQASTSVGGTVPDGNCGVMIWKPTTTRRYGRVMKGCVGQLQQQGTWMADDRGTGEYNGIPWIAGARSLCIKKGNNPPLSRCQGSGNFI